MRFLRVGKQRVAAAGVFPREGAAYSRPIPKALPKATMKNALRTAVATLTVVSSLAWAEATPPAPHPPLQCACVAGGPVA